MEQTAQLYVAYDKVAQSVLGVVMQFAHDAPAVRMFVDSLQADGFMSKHPADFELHAIGEIGMGSRKLTSYETPRLVLSGEAWAAAQENAQ